MPKGSDVAQNQITIPAGNTLTPGKAVLHMEFTPRGENLWLSVRDEDRVEIYDTGTFQRLQTLSVEKPSGIFLTARAHRIGL